METMNITVKGRSVKVFAWTLNTMETASYLKTHGARGLSWKLLSDKKATGKAQAEMGGEEASSNFALNILENALDWSLGLAAARFIRDALAVRKCPRSFRLAVTKKGDVFVVLTNKAGEQIVLEA